MIYFHDQKNEQVYAVRDGDRLGSADQCEHQFADDHILPEHAVVTLKNGNIFIETFHNQKATYLNGLKLVSGRKYLIRPSDKLKLGGVILILSTNPTLGQIEEDDLHNDDPPEFTNDFTLGGLRLESQDESPSIATSSLTKMKKIRRVIVELQETKRQLEVKTQEREDLLREIDELGLEIKELSLFVGKYRERPPQEIEAEVEAEKADMSLLEYQIEQNRRVLQELEQKRSELEDRVKLKRSIVRKLKEFNSLISKEAYLKHSVEVLDKLD